MAVYGPVCHLQNITWTEAKHSPIYYRLATKKNIEDKRVKYNKSFMLNIHWLMKERLNTRKQEVNNQLVFETNFLIKRQKCIYLKQVIPKGEHRVHKNVNQ